VFIDVGHPSDTAPEPDADDDGTLHSTTTQPTALIGFLMHHDDDDEAKDSLANSDSDTTYGDLPSLHQGEDILSDDDDDDETVSDPPSLHQREDILSDDDETLGGSRNDNVPDAAGPHPDDDVDGNDHIPWVQGAHGRTRGRLHNNDGTYTLPQKVATTYGLCQSALTWMSLKGDAGQL
jgi:hypothetical protein